MPVGFFSTPTAAVCADKSKCEGGGGASDTSCTVLHPMAVCVAGLEESDVELVVRRPGVASRDSVQRSSEAIRKSDFFKNRERGFLLKKIHPPETLLFFGVIIRGQRSATLNSNLS